MMRAIFKKKQNSNDFKENISWFLFCFATKMENIVFADRGILGDSDEIYICVTLQKDAKYSRLLSRHLQQAVQRWLQDAADTQEN